MILSPGSTDGAHNRKASQLTLSDAVLSARTPDLYAPNKAHCEGTNLPRQLYPDNTGDRNRDRVSFLILQVAVVFLDYYLRRKMTTQAA